MRSLASDAISRNYKGVRRTDFDPHNHHRKHRRDILTFPFYSNTSAFHNFTPHDFVFNKSQFIHGPDVGCSGIIAMESASRFFCAGPKCQAPVEGPFDEITGATVDAVAGCSIETNCGLDLILIFDRINRIVRIYFGFLPILYLL